MPRIVFAGEAMIELSREGDGWQLGSAGDTLNTAVHLAALGNEVGYLTALGSDPFSRELTSEWQERGIDCSLVLTNPDRLPGLYAIVTDADGERSFSYWRENSAARTLFSLPGVEEAIARAEATSLFGYSLISLAILPDGARPRMLDLAGRVRGRGGKVAFDGNYRAALWPGSDEAVAARDEAIGLADFGLPTLEDEAQLSGHEDPLQVLDHWRRLGCDEVVVKLGAEGCMLPDGSVVPPPERLHPVDTSGAGDAFNAGYLDARLAGASVRDAALAGHKLAGRTVMHRGAIPPLR